MKAINHLHIVAGVAHTDLELENIVRMREDVDDIRNSTGRCSAVRSNVESH